MKKLIIFYSYGGNTRRLAQSLARKEQADLYEVKDAKRPGTLKAYTAGCVAAMSGKSTAIEPVKADLSAYDSITVMAPVWASNPAPAVNNVFDLLPSGKIVDIVMVSASGKSGAREKLRSRILARGCTMGKYEDSKG